MPWIPTPNPAYDVGTVHTDNHNNTFTVIEYNGHKDVLVRFHDTDYECVTRVETIKRGNIHYPYNKTVLGIGYLGVGKHPASRMGKRQPTKTYSVWSGILKRCYNPNQKDYSRYGAKGVTVHPDWHNFQNFADWYYSECERLGIDPDNNDYQVDKDEFSGSVKMYSADTCQLVTAQKNTEVANAKSYWFTDPSGLHVQVNNLTKFCAEHGLCRIRMGAVSNYKEDSYQGWAAA